MPNEDIELMPLVGWHIASIDKTAIALVTYLVKDGDHARAYRAELAPPIRLCIMIPPEQVEKMAKALARTIELLQEQTTPKRSDQH